MELDPMSQALVDESGLKADDVYEYLGGTRAAIMRRYIYEDNQRIGQAFYNALEPNDARKLNGHIFDPFYADNWPVVIRALIFLLEN